jgi:hypothetical protein
MMSAYRELNKNDRETAELDAHLEQCAACREVLASYARVGEQVHDAPAFAPPPDMHAKLMKALADEQLKFLQKSAPGSVATPEFLKPYLQERARETQSEDDIAAFSTAETGPLPLLHTRRKRRPVSLRVNQLGVFGLTAAALILLMLGGLTSFLMLERGNPTSPSLSRTSNSVNRPTEVNQKVYSTSTLYPNVTSALPLDNEVYFTAYGDGVNSSSWMLMQFDRNTGTLKPLLDSPSTDPLIVLSVSHNWLVWLQYSAPQTATHLHLPPSDYYTSPRSWSVNYLSLLPANQNADTTQGSATTGTQGGSKSGSGASQALINDPDLANMPTVYPLTKGVFDSATAPSWVNSPIGGSWLVGDTDTLLLSQIDEKGISHLDSYQLDQSAKQVQAQEITTAPAGHLLAWPTTSSTGMQIYWADEWTTDDGELQSNIWQRQTTEQALRSHGQLEEVDTSTQQELQSDGMSFQPQVVDNTLFFLSTSEIRVEGQNVVSPNGTPFPTSATDTKVQFTPRTDTGVYGAPPDASVHGTLMMLPLDGPSIGVESMLGTVGQSTGYQAGSTYVIWQDASGYQMYDVEHQSDVVLGDTLNNASLLVVNGNTALWLNGNPGGAQLRLMAFTWAD